MDGYSDFGSGSRFFIYLASAYRTNRSGRARQKIDLCPP